MEEKCFLCGKTARVESTTCQSNAEGTHKVVCERCGTYHITESASEAVQDDPELEKKRWIFAGYTREHSEFVRPVRLDTPSLHQIPFSSEVPRDVSEKMDKVLSYIARKSEFAGHAVCLVFDNDYPVAFARDRRELDYFARCLCGMSILQMDITNNNFAKFTLTPGGWQRYEILKKSRLLSKQAFVAMASGEKMKDVFQNGISKAIVEAGYEPLLIEIEEHNERICDRIIAEIRRSKFVVADVTCHRPNVYFEAGFAMGLNLEVFFTCREDAFDQRHFDTSQYKHTLWKTPEDLYTSLLWRIKARNL
ncbi:MAG: hypothetical protein RDV41_13150 [Planctomycetota bacterium]|nr:hypothetical protein [Planctomycetota bacterium]